MLAVTAWSLFNCIQASGEAFIVKDGQPQAEIVIGANPPRMVKLAAEELQTYVEKITGTKLAITNAPAENVPVKIYVGKSPDTDRLGISDEGLKYGAFRIVSGKNYLVLLGYDSDFSPKKPFLNGGADMPRLMEEWDKATGEKWGYPYEELWKSYSTTMKIWEQDARGSLNAVYEFLRMQGVRWYFPGDIGEIVPKKTAIEVPSINKTVHPDFALRYPYQYYNRFGTDKKDEILWQLRLGLNQAPDLIGPGYIAHGTALVIERDEVKQDHPEYYALIGGKRQNGANFSPCLSSDGLFQANVKFVRAVFDIFDAPMISVMPTDGLSTICQCDLCKGKATPERGWDGQYSDYVWAYVNRVADEVYKTHPNKKIVGMAYSTYLLPPTKIDKLCPNLVVCMEQRRSNLVDPVRLKKYTDLRKAWLDKLPEGHKEFIGYDYYRHGTNTPNLPVFFPYAIAKDLRLLKGISLGDYIEVYRDKKEIGILAIDHLNTYVTSQFWWNADQDVDVLLAEYYKNFYGPAAAEMKNFIEYCESNQFDLGKNPETIGMVFELLVKAQKKVPSDSVYGKRIAMIADYIQPMRALREQLAKGRGNVPEAIAFNRNKADIKIDGKLDEKFWEGMRLYKLSELQTGRDPISNTSFRVGWDNDALYFGIQCKDSDMKNLNIGTDKNEEANIWNGDCVEILLETSTHSYYQIVVNPAGALMDLDRKTGINTLWKSGAEVATSKDEGCWNIEIRIPVVDPSQEDLDPLSGVCGRIPSDTYPWYFNVCRQRIRGNETERSAFSPTGSEGFHELMKFGKLVVR